MLARTKGYADVESNVESALVQLKHNLADFGLRPVLVGGTADGKVLFRAHCEQLDRKVVDATREVLGNDVEFMYDGGTRELRLRASFYPTPESRKYTWWRLTVEAALVVAALGVLIARRAR